MPIDMPLNAKSWIILNEDKISKYFVLTLLPIIAVVEYIFVYTSIGYGIILALIITIIIYIVVSIPKQETDAMRSAESLALIPLYVLFTSSLPWFFINPRFLLPAVYSIILALCFFHIYEKNIKMIDLGIVADKWLKYVALGSLIGIPTGYIEYLVLLPAPQFPTFELRYFIIDYIYMLFFVSLAEELLFRGIIQNDLQRVFGERKGLFMAAYLFGVMHLTWRSVTELGFTFFAGYLLGYIYNRTNSLTAPIFLHAMNNLMLVSILPYVLV